MATTTRTPRARTSSTKKPADAAGAETPASTDAPAVPDFATNSAKAKPEERRPLFSIDGEEFTVPAKISERIVFLGMDSIRTEGSATFASMRLMELVLGIGQYRRLTELYEQEAITEEQFGQIVDMVSRIFFDHFGTKKEEAEGKGDGAAS